MQGLFNKIIRYKYDIIIGLIILMIGVILSVTYFFKYNSSNNLNLQIYYRNTLVYQEEIDSSTSYILEMEAILENNLLVITKKDQTTLEEISKNEFNIEILYQAKNTLLVNYEEIKMIEASCPNKECCKMKMSYKSHTPIVCTSGFCIMISSKELEVLV